MWTDLQTSVYSYVVEITLSVCKLVLMFWKITQDPNETCWSDDVMTWGSLNCVMTQWSGGNSNTKVHPWQAPNQREGRLWRGEALKRQQLLWNFIYTGWNTGLINADARYLVFVWFFYVNYVKDRQKRWIISFFRSTTQNIWHISRWQKQIQ